MLVKDTILNKEPQFSSKQIKLANYILANMKQVSFMNSTDLASAAGVSNPTVIRFISFIGYDGYAHFQKELQKNVLNYFTSLEQATHIISNSSQDDSMNQMDAIVEKIPWYFINRNREVLKQAAKLLSESEDVYFIGNQVSSVFLRYCVYEFLKYKKGIHALNNENLEYYDLIRNPTEKKCAVVFALQRYPNRTLTIVKELYEAQMPIILFTDSDLFPYLHMAKYVLYSPAESASFVVPIINTFLLIMDLQRQMIMLDADKVLENVKRFEEYEVLNKIYYKLSLPLKLER